MTRFWSIVENFPPSQGLTPSKSSRELMTSFILTIESWQLPEEVISKLVKAFLKFRLIKLGRSPSRALAKFEDTKSEILDSFATDAGMSAVET